MKRKNIQFLFIGFVFVFFSCTKEKTLEIPASGYPPEIENIIVPTCATIGCHTPNDKEAAGGLALDTWKHLFEGGRGGAVVIPYRADQSWLCYYINTFDDLGIQLNPTMPFSTYGNEKQPLSRAEVETIFNWINQGAPDANDCIAFTGQPGRNKFYVANQGCDLVTVFDINSKLAMRYVDVGVSSLIESPHNIRVSPDGKYWYVIFAQSNVIQKFDAETDELIASCGIKQGSWNVFTISADGSKAFIADWQANGRIAYVDLEIMDTISYIQGNGLLINPHGIIASQDFNTLYVTAEQGNYLYKVDLTDIDFPEVSTVSLYDPPQPALNDFSLRPHDFIFSPDFSKLYVTCQASNEVRVLNTTNDSIIEVIPVGTYPVEFARSSNYPYLFVTCMEDPCGDPVCKGSVYVINYETDQIVTKIQTKFYQPHGIAVDDVNDLVYVANRNWDGDGPTPHHTGACAGNNGFVQFIDMNTLEVLTDLKSEVSIDPYQVAVRNCVDCL